MPIIINKETMEATIMSDQELDEFLASEKENKTFYICTDYFILNQYMINDTRIIQTESFSIRSINEFPRQSKGSRVCRRKPTNCCTN